MRYLLAHPALLAGLIAFAFVFILGASIGGSLAKHSDVPVKWVGPVFFASVVIGAVVVFLLGGGI